MKPTKERLLGIMPKIAINARTKAQALKLIKWYEARDLTWYHGNGATENYEGNVGCWGVYKKDTCYSHDDWMESDGNYDSRDYFKEIGFTIITVPEFFKIIE